MEFIFYFVFRRFFVSLNFDEKCIHLRKGLILRRVYNIPCRSVTCAEIKRTPLLRLLRGKKVTLYTLSGKVSFYLRKDESLPIFKTPHVYNTLCPGFGALLLGTFSRTRALGGTVVFSVAISRIGTVLGSNYYDGIINAINRTAGDLRDVLESLRIAVPRVTAVLAVFIGASWLFAFIRNLLRFCRFRLRLGRGYACASHGFITLYEEMFVPNALGTVIVRDTASTLLFKAAPIYCHGRMLAPPLLKKKRSSVLRAFLGESEMPDVFQAAPPKRALFGHIALPLGWGAFAAALLLLCYITDSAPILRTFLWGGVMLCLWRCIIFGIYMKHTGFGRKRTVTVAAARKESILVTAYIPSEQAVYHRIDRNPFQHYSGMCDLRLFCRGKIKLRLRNMYYAKISGLL